MTRPSEPDDDRGPERCDVRTVGRKRDVSRNADLCQAALEVLAEVGYDRLTVDIVAARVGAGKATVYRRWPSKAELVVEAVSRMKGAAEEPDTGSLRGDLEAIACGSVSMNDPFTTNVMAGLVSALVRDADLRAVFLEHFVAPRRQVLRDLFQRAVERGEISPPSDIDLLIEVFPSMVFHRVITSGRPVDDDFARTVIDLIILPLATGIPACAPNTAR